MHLSLGLIFVTSEELEAKLRVCLVLGTFSGDPNKKPSFTVQAVHNNTDFTKMNQNEVVRIHTNFFEYLRIRKLIRENEFVTLNL